MTEEGPTRRRKTDPRIARRRLRLLWVIGIVGLSVYLYYRPIASYVETKRDLAARRAEVERLRSTRIELEQRLASTSSPASIEREARRIGYVRPGEQLFVVQGISEWRADDSEHRRRS